MKNISPFYKGKNLNQLTEGILPLTDMGNFTVKISPEKTQYHKFKPTFLDYPRQ